MKRTAVAALTGVRHSVISRKGSGSISFLTTASLCTRRAVLASSSMGDAARDRMMGEIASAGSGSCASGDASAKTILVRGCDPRMAQRAGQMLPPQLGNAAIESVTTDDDLFAKLGTRKFDVVMFAPGACRYSEARQPIPGGNAKTKGWSLEEYRSAVREALGDAVPIVETTEERLIIPLLREALGLPKI